jgi:hypothetical protein
MVAGSYHFREVVHQTISSNDFPRLISLVRALAPDSGSARELGDGLQWEQDSGYTALSLTINPEPDGTVIRADLRTDGRQVAYALGGIGASLLAGFVATALSVPLGPTLGLGVAVLGVSSWVARRLWLASSRRSAARIHRLVTSLAAGLRGELDESV